MIGPLSRVRGWGPPPFALCHETDWVLLPCGLCPCPGGRWRLSEAAVTWRERRRMWRRGSTLWTMEGDERSGREEVGKASERVDVGGCREAGLGTAREWWGDVRVRVIIGQGKKAGPESGCGVKEALGSRGRRQREH